MNDSSFVVSRTATVSCGALVAESVSGSEALEAGAERARTIARETMGEVKTKMGLA